MKVNINLENHYMKYFEKYENDPRFVSIRYEDRGHNDLFDSNGELMKRIIEFCDKHAF